MDVSQLQQQLNYQFNDGAWLKHALTHRSYSSHSNERLEFLGDSILGFVIASELYHRFPTAKEGQLSRMRSHLVRGTTLADIGQSLNLGEYIRFSTGELKSGGKTRSSNLADTVEAIIAAVYQDGGWEAAKSLILFLYQQRLDNLSLDDLNKDPKSRLQEYLQAKKTSLPNYRIIDMQGADHQQTFTVQCEIPDLKLTTTATDSSKKKAEKEAAHLMLQELGIQ